MVLIHLVALMLVAAEPGPLDAFRANYASTRVNTEFLFEVGTASRELVTGGGLWTTNQVGFVEDAVRRVAGRWECDGTTEHLVCAPSGKEAEEAAHAARSKAAQQPIIAEQPPLEVLFDGEAAAWHLMDEGSSTIQLGYIEHPPFLHHGPYMWFGPFPFLLSLRKDYGELKPTRKLATIGGHSTELEIYKHTNPNIWEQMEIYYDSSIGYLPRFHRVIAMVKDGTGESMAMVKDMYMTDARSCSVGGFVPTEWYVASYRIDHFERDYPDYDAGTVLKPASAQLTLTRYRTTSFQDRKGAVYMDQLKDLRFIGGVGGVVPIKDSPATLTLHQLKSRLTQRKMTAPKVPVGPGVDFAELNEDTRANSTNYWYALFPAILIALVSIYFTRRKGIAKLCLIFACLLAAPGCGYGGSPVVHLAASFDRTNFLNETNAQWLPLSLVVRNEGNQPVQIFEINGGCSCRKVDQSQMPALLKPGQNLKLPVQIQDSRNSEPQYITFSYNTDHGTLNTSATLHVVPKHLVRPAAVTLNVLEDEEGIFELTHRVVYRSDMQSTETRLVVPPVFAETGRTISEGKLDTLSGYSFRDTIYSFRLKDQEFGLQKDSIILKEPDHGKILDVAVVYRRTKFLHSAPETVYLGIAPVRVFLRCPDESVELTQVKSAPKGVRAVLSSANELIIRLGDDAPEIINGIVKVGTTAKTKDPELCIPVIRYARGAQGSAS